MIAISNGYATFNLGKKTDETGRKAAITDKKQADARPALIKPGKGVSL